MKYLMLALLAASFFLNAAPRRYDDDIWIRIKEIGDTTDDLRREIQNQESEMKTLYEKANTQEDRLDHVQKELRETHQSQKEQLKNHAGTLESKIASLESAQKGLIADVKQIKVHANETDELLKAYRDKISELERSVAAMQSALGHLMDMVKTTSGVIVEGGVKFYQVKSGDSLEKIARANKTTIKAIKELNGLTKDQITIGQILKIPE